MNTTKRFGPDDEPAFGAARRELLAAYEAFLRAARPVADLFIADLMLMYQWQYGDGRILHWTRADLDGFLLDYLPQKTALSEEDIDAVPADAGDFLDWLAGRGLLSGEALPRLHAAITELTPAFRRATAEPMADPDPGLGSGLDPMPAVELATDPELAAAAAASAVLARLTTITRFLDPRRKLTQKGHLSMADGRVLTEQLGIAFGVQYGEHVYPIRSTEEIAVLDRSFRWARAVGDLTGSAVE